MTPWMVTLHMRVSKNDPLLTAEFIRQRHISIPKAVSLHSHIHEYVSIVADLDEYRVDSFIYWISRSTDVRETTFIFPGHNLIHSLG